MAVVVPGVGVEDLSGVNLIPFSRWSRTSCRRVAMTRSQWAFIRGARGAVHNLDVIGREDPIEGARVLPVPVTDQEAQ
jgi:hypothetical protein